jgi:hypothetical protein
VNHTPRARVPPPPPRLFLAERRAARSEPEAPLRPFGAHENLPTCACQKLPTFNTEFRARSDHGFMIRAVRRVLVLGYGRKPGQYHPRRRRVVGLLFLGVSGLL